MARPRSSGRRDLPNNLYLDVGRGKFRYTHPKTGRRSWMGSDRAKAIAAALKLNAILEEDHDLSARVLRGEKTMSEVLKWFKGKELPRRNLAQRTQTDYLRKVAVIDDALGKKVAARIGLNDFAQFLRTWDEKPVMRNSMRGILVDICRCAIAEGWMTTNYPAATRKVEAKKKRQRLTKELFDAIHAAAPEWLKAAMELELTLLARPEDLVLLRFDEHIDGDVLKLDVQKSAEETGGERVARTQLDIEIDDHLARILASCRHKIISPYLVSCPTIRIQSRGKWPSWRRHWTQISAEYFSGEFSKVRDAVVRKNPKKWGRYAPDKHPPSVYEIKSLGAAIYRDSGMPEEFIQALIGHTDINTTRIYLKGHTPPRKRVSREGWE